MSRALRRHHRQRMVARAYRMNERYGVEEPELTRVAAQYADNMAWCSCSGCGNPRRFHGRAVKSWKWSEPRSRQEVLSEWSFREQVEEVMSVE